MYNVYVIGLSYIVSLVVSVSYTKCKLYQNVVCKSEIQIVLDILSL